MRTGVVSHNHISPLDETQSSLQQTTFRVKSLNAPDPSHRIAPCEYRVGHFLLEVDHFLLESKLGGRPQGPWQPAAAARGGPLGIHARVAGSGKTSAGMAWINID